MARKRKNWVVPEGTTPTPFDLRILEIQAKGHLVPTRQLIKTPEQIEGIRRAGEINTAILDMLEEKIRVGMTTGEIDRLVADFTERHGAICAPLNYEGFPRHCCTSINEVVCHGIPSDDEELWDGDILNVDVTTILNGYYADASRMFCIGQVEPRVQRLVDCARECLEIGIEAAQPWHYVGEIGKAIERHARQDGFSVVRDLAGHGTGNAFHEDPVIDHYDTRQRGMLLVPGMVFTIEPMINMGTHEVFIDEEDGWTVVTEDELPSAQWEHTFVMTEDGLEILTH
ncbi:MAG: type I methionyl aminopeptidase [Alloprevotella sp.]